MASIRGRSLPSTLRNFLVVAAGTAALAACEGAVRREVASVPPPPPPAPEMQTFEATAYSIEGTTASGKQTRDGVCAADPDVLPLGSRIRVHDAGPHSGECEIADTGRAIKGREIDIYVPDDRAAKRFGRKQVRVEVLSRAE
ncbi:MAG: 3D domain-containing protein [Thermodesulfobacteriota bacterium]